MDLEDAKAYIESGRVAQNGAQNFLLSTEGFHNLFNTLYLLFTGMEEAYEQLDLQAAKLKELEDLVVKSSKPKGGKSAKSEE